MVTTCGGQHGGTGGQAGLEHGDAPALGEHANSANIRLARRLTIETTIDL